MALFARISTRAWPVRFWLGFLLLLAVVMSGCTGWGPGGGTGHGSQGGAAVGTMPGRLAYVHDGDLWLRGGTENVQVTTNGGVSQPRWSADGSHLFFLRGYPGDGKELWLLTAETKKIVRLGQADTLASGQPRWSPGGTHIAFIPWNDDWRQPDEGVATVSLSGEVQRVLPPGSGATDLAYHPDGWLAVALRARPLDVNNPFARTIEQQRQATIVKVPGVGAAPEVLARLGTSPQPGAAMFIESGGGLRFDPTGNYLTFFAYPNSASLAADGVDLMVVPASGGAPENLVTMLAYDDFLAWSPDGQRLAVIQGSGRDVRVGKELVVLAAGSFAPEAALTPAGQIDLTPAWAPDSTTVATSRGLAVELPDSHEEPRHIWLTDIGTGQGGPLPPAEPAVIQETPVWGGPGQGLLYVQRSTDPDGAAELRWSQPNGGEAGPVATLGPAEGYYGHVRWHQQFDWYPGD